MKKTDRLGGIHIFYSAHFNWYFIQYHLVYVEVGDLAILFSFSFLFLLFEKYPTAVSKSSRSMLSEFTINLDLQQPINVEERGTLNNSEAIPFTVPVFPRAFEASS